MAVPAWAAAAIQGGTGIAGGLISGFMNRAENKKARAWNEKMYWTQEKREQDKWYAENAYAENVWNMQNKYNEQMWHQVNNYNSPMSQMTRFKEAGLNPALIYGQSNTSGNIATAQFGKNSMGRGALGNATPTRFDISAGDFMSTYINSRESSARVNNLEAQNELIKQDVIKRAAETVGIGTTNQKNVVELENLKRYSADAAEAAINRTNAETRKIGTEQQVLLNRDEREAVMQSSNLNEAAERILNMRGQRMNMQLENKIKDLDYQLKVLGIQPSDGMFMRMFGQWLNEYAPAPIDLEWDKRW